MASEVKLKWIEEMLPLLKNVDILLLANIHPTVIPAQKRAEPEKSAENEAEIKKKEDEKLKAAKERYLQRKKQ